MIKVVLMILLHEIYTFHHDTLHAVLQLERYINAWFCEGEGLFVCVTDGF